jgi:hypothetical protein
VSAREAIALSAAAANHESKNHAVTTSNATVIQSISPS